MRSGSFSSFKFFCEDEMMASAVPQQSRIRDDTVDKLDCHGDWVRRRLILTQDRLYIALSKSWFPHAHGNIAVNVNPIADKWQNCYSVLRTGKFECYDTEDDFRRLKKPFFSLNVLGCRLSDEDDVVEGFPFAIRINDAYDQPIVCFNCESHQDMRRWTKVLKDHGNCLLANEQVEIVDSIPTEEIVAVTRVLQNPFLKHKNQDRRWSPFATGLKIKSVNAGVSHSRHNSLSLSRHNSNHEGLECLKEAEEVEEVVLPGYSRVAATRYLQRDDGEVMEIETIPDGYNSGRAFFFFLPSNATVDDWVDIIASTAKERRLEYSKKHWIDIWQHRACLMLDSIYFQGVMAALIIANFFLIIAQTQIRPEAGSDLDNQFQLVDLAFTIIFTVGETGSPPALLRLVATSSADTLD